MGLIETLRTRCRGRGPHAVAGGVLRPGTHPNSALPMMWPCSRPARAAGRPARLRSSPAGSSRGTPSGRGIFMPATVLGAVVRQMVQMSAISTVCHPEHPEGLGG
jgi:hypothetical protein